MPDRALGNFNTRAWARGNYVADYSDPAVNPADALLFARFASDLTGSILEIGPGAGRLTRILAGLSDDVLALDVSRRMVDQCRVNVPGARVELGDFRRVGAIAAKSFDAIVAGDSVIDTVSDSERRQVLADFRRLTRDDGLLLFSSHNFDHLGYVAPAHIASRAGLRSPRKIVRGLLDAPARLRLLVNRLQARRYEYRSSDHAIVNNGAHQNRLVHYFVGRDTTARQVAAAGWELIDCVDDDGRTVLTGEVPEHSYVLHYVARAKGTPADW